MIFGLLPMKAVVFVNKTKVKVIWMDLGKPNLI